MPRINFEGALSFFGALEQKGGGNRDVPATGKRGISTRRRIDQGRTRGVLMGGTRRTQINIFQIIHIYTLYIIMYILKYCSFVIQGGCFDIIFSFTVEYHFFFLCTTVAEIVLFGCAVHLGVVAVWGASPHLEQQLSTN